MILSFRVWDKKNNKYLQESQFAILDNGKLIVTHSGYYEHFTNTNQDDYLVEYCTGYQDINGKYLYINDYVEYQLGLKRIRCRIIYDHFSFKLAEIRGGYMDFTQQKYTLVGNYHDSKPD